MTIVDSRIKVSFTKEEREAFFIIMHILKKLQVEDVKGFINAITDYDSIFYDRNEFDEEPFAVFEFLDNETGFDFAGDEEEEEEEE